MNNNAPKIIQIGEFVSAHSTKEERQKLRTLLDFEDFVLSGAPWSDFKIEHPSASLIKSACQKMSHEIAQLEMDWTLPYPQSGASCIQKFLLECFEEKEKLSSDKDHDMGLSRHVLSRLLKNKKISPFTLLPCPLFKHKKASLFAIALAIRSPLVSVIWQDIQNKKIPLDQHQPDLGEGMYISIQNQINNTPRAYSFKDYYKANHGILCQLTTDLLALHTAEKDVKEDPDATHAWTAVQVNFWGCELIQEELIPSKESLISAMASSNLLPSLVVNLKTRASLQCFSSIMEGLDPTDRHGLMEKWLVGIEDRVKNQDAKIIGGVVYHNPSVCLDKEQSLRFLRASSEAWSRLTASDLAREVSRFMDQSKPYHLFYDESAFKSWVEQVSNLSKQWLECQNNREREERSYSKINLKDAQDKEEAAKEKIHLFLQISFQSSSAPAPDKKRKI